MKKYYLLLFVFPTFGWSQNFHTLNSNWCAGTCTTQTKPQIRLIPVSGDHPPLTNVSANQTNSIFLNDLFREHNTYRRQNRIGLLKADLVLSLAAQRHSDDMARNNYFEHTSPTSGLERPLDRVLRAIQDSNLNRPTQLGVGENIYFSTNKPTARQVIEALKKSSGHNENMLRPKWKSIGVGLSKGIRGWYVTVVFSDNRTSSGIRTATNTTTAPTPNLFNLNTALPNSGRPTLSQRLNNLNSPLLPLTSTSQFRPIQDPPNSLFQGSGNLGFTPEELGRAANLLQRMETLLEQQRALAVPHDVISRPSGQARPIFQRPQQLRSLR